MHRLSMPCTYIMSEYIRKTHYFIFSATRCIYLMYLHKKKKKAGTFTGIHRRRQELFLNCSNICVKTCQGAKYASVVVAGSNCVGIHRYKLILKLSTEHLLTFLGLLFDHFFFIII